MPTQKHKSISKTLARELAYSGEIGKIHNEILLNRFATEILDKQSHDRYCPYYWPDDILAMKIAENCRHTCNRAHRQALHVFIADNKKSMGVHFAELVLAIQQPQKSILSRSDRLLSIAAGKSKRDQAVYAVNLAEIAAIYSEKSVISEMLHALRDISGAELLEYYTLGLYGIVAHDWDAYTILRSILQSAPDQADWIDNSFTFIISQRRHKNDRTTSA